SCEQHWKTRAKRSWSVASQKEIGAAIGNAKPTEGFASGCEKLTREESLSYYDWETDEE
ncbi:hypothetical protein HPP92_004803, partial [Vanilla planifolia]